MNKAEPLAVFQLLHEVCVFFVHIEKSVKVSGICVVILTADIAGTLFFVCPCGHGIVEFPGTFQAVHKGKLCGFKLFHLACKFIVDFLEVCLQNPCVSKGIAVLVHLEEMVSAETLLVGEVADIALHVRGAGAKCKIK